MLKSLCLLDAYWSAVRSWKVNGELMHCKHNSLPLQIMTYSSSDNVFYNHSDVSWTFKAGKEGAGKDSDLAIWPWSQSASLHDSSTHLWGRELRWKDFKMMPVTELVPEPRSLIPQLMSLIALHVHLFLGMEELCTIRNKTILVRPCSPAES